MSERILTMVNIIALHLFPLTILILLFLHRLFVDVRLADIMQKRGDNHTLFWQSRLKVGIFLYDQITESQCHLTYIHDEIKSLIKNHSVPLSDILGQKLQQ